MVGNSHLNKVYKNKNNWKSEQQMEQTIPITDADLEHKKGLFERFLTYKRRMSRMASIQAIYMLDIHISALKIDKYQLHLFHDKQEIKPSTFCHSIIYLYKNHFLKKINYGTTQKTKKLDEKFLYEFVKFTASNLKEIDESIESCLHENWKIDNLDVLVRAILRCAIGEKLFIDNSEIAIITSEYTNLASYFFSGKEIGFINGIIHNYILKSSK